MAAQPEHETISVRRMIDSPFADMNHKNVVRNSSPGLRQLPWECNVSLSSNRKSGCTNPSLQGELTMPQSLSVVYIHLVFSTKNRQPFFRDKEIRVRLHAQLGGISKTLGCPPILTGGRGGSCAPSSSFRSHHHSSRMDQRIEAGVEPLAEKRICAFGF